MIPPELRARYRGYEMKDYEILMVEAFRKMGVVVGEWKFRVLLETPESLEIKEKYPELPIEHRMPWMLKIDAVVEGPDFVAVIEFEKWLHTRTLGKILTYSELYKRQYKPEKPIRKVVVAARDSKAIRNLLFLHGIEYYLVKI